MILLYVVVRTPAAYFCSVHRACVVCTRNGGCVRTAHIRTYKTKTTRVARPRLTDVFLFFFVRFASHSLLQVHRSRTVSLFLDFLFLFSTWPLLRLKEFSHSQAIEYVCLNISWAMRGVHVFSVEWECSRDNIWVNYPHSFSRPYLYNFELLRCHILFYFYCLSKH